MKIIEDSFQMKIFKIIFETVCEFKIFNEPFPQWKIFINQKSSRDFNSKMFDLL